MPLLKEFLLKSIRAIAQNPEIDLQSIGMYKNSDTSLSNKSISRTPHYNGYNPKTIN